MSQNRRDFLKLTSAGVVAWGLNVPAFLSRAAALAPASDKPGGKDTVLVVVEFTGGNDGLNMVVPYNDDDYKKARPTLAIPGSQVKKINDQLGLHPGMDGLAELLQDNALCRRAGRRLSQLHRVALPLDGHLADGRPGRRADGRLDRQGAQRACPAPRRSTSRPATRRRRWRWKAPRCACRRSPRWRSSSSRRPPPTAPTRRTSAT